MNVALIRILLIALAMLATSIAPAAAIVPKAVASASTVHGYYLAKFTDEVGDPLPFSSLCLLFRSNGAWYSVPPSAFNGTYLTSGNDLFASAVAPWSPTVYASLQGSVNAKQGSGDYIITQPSGAIFSGGTFTLTRSASCR